MIKLFPGRIEAKPAVGRFGPAAGNAFRTLGLAATAAQGEVFDAAAGLRLALKLGVQKTFEGDLPWLGPVGRTESDVRAAVGRLSEPVQRARERLFWFHGRLTDAPASTVAELSLAVDALLRGAPTQVDDADGVGVTGEAAAALHDAALLALAGLVRLDPLLGHTGEWARAFALWRRVFACEGFWSLLVVADLKGDYEQPVTFGEVAGLRLRAPREVSAHVAGRARDAARRGDLRAAARALELLRGAGLPAALLREYEQEAVGPVEDALTEELDTAFGWVVLISLGARPAPSRLNYYNRAWRDFESLRPRLAEFALLAGADSYFARRVFEHAASKLFQLAAAFEEAGRSEEGRFVCLKARELAPPGAEELPAVEEKLRALGGGGVLGRKDWDTYGDALARELADAWVPDRLFKDDPKGVKTPEGSQGQQADSAGCLTTALCYLFVVAVCFGMQKCGIINTRPTRTPINSLPPLNVAPKPPALNLNLNYNLRALNLSPYVTEPPEKKRPRGRKRRPPQNGSAPAAPPPTATRAAPDTPSPPPE